MKRRGFTLIELMVVIAIIIILAAIAIPNYLSMTARAKRSRVASDFAALATTLETYRTDWNTYPVASKQFIISGTSLGLPGTAGVGAELTGTTGTAVNATGKTTAAGETGPIEYMTANILTSMVNPYSNLPANQYKYTGVLASSTVPASWTLSVATLETATGKGFLVRKDTQTVLSDTSTDPNAGT